MPLSYTIHTTPHTYTQPHSHASLIHNTHNPTHMHTTPHTYTQPHSHASHTQYTQPHTHASLTQYTQPHTHASLTHTVQAALSQVKALDVCCLIIIPQKAPSGSLVALPANVLLLLHTEAINKKMFPSPSPFPICNILNQPRSLLRFHLEAFECCTAIKA